MSTLQQEYLHLISLTKLYLLKETSLKGQLRVSRDDLEYFRETFRKSKSEKKSKLKQESPAIVDPREQPTIISINEDRGTIIDLTQLKLDEVRSPENPILSAKHTPVPPLSIEPTHVSVSTPPLPPQSEPTPVETIAQADTTYSEPLSKVKQTEKQSFLKLEPILSPLKPSCSTEWAQIFKNLFPNVPIYENPPADLVAKKFQNQWKQAQEILPVAILAFHKDKVHEGFLKSIAQAITLRLAPARVIFADEWKKSNSWSHLIEAPHLRLVIANDYEIYMQPELMQYYKENANEGKHFLGKTPLLLLSDLSLYLKEPSLKALLWRAICNEFATFKK